jgi:cell division protein FtsL
MRVRIRTFVAGALGVLSLFFALSLVTWRQTRARESLTEVDRLRREASLLEAEREDMEGRIQALESRARVVSDARSELGMRAPGAESIVLLAPASMGEENR